MKRLDNALVEFGVAPSRNKAQALIEAGEVEIENGGSWSTATHSNQNAENLTNERIRLTESAKTLRYVSRGGLKLEAALKHLAVEFPPGTVVFDVGQSTGGFTDCVLQAGASRVIGIDVGHGQLSEKLAGDPRVESHEGLNVRELSSEFTEKIRRAAGFCVADVSFISLEQVLPSIAGCLRPGVHLLALVKPQFEVGPRKLDPALFPEVQAQTLRVLGKCGFSIKDYFASEVKGQDGTQEFFVYAVRS